MTSQISSAEFGVVVQGQSELRADLRLLSEEHRTDMKAISQAQADLSVKFSRFLDITGGITEDVKELKHDLHGDGGIKADIVTLKVRQEGNKVRWQILAAGIAFMLATIGTVASLVIVAIDKLSSAFIAFNGGL